MNVKSRINRIAGACMLLMMILLALGTVTFIATAKGKSSSSYSLIVKKQFAPDTPPEILKKAKEQSYTFKIEGTRKTWDKTNEKWTDVKVNETVTLPRDEGSDKVWESRQYSSDGPFDVTVTELTDNINITDDRGNHYSMAGSSSDTKLQINGRKHEIELRNNSILTITRPKDDGPEKLWYHLTNRPYDGRPSSNFEKLDMTFPLKKEENIQIKKTPSNRTLRAAIYTIEQVAAPDGYQLQMGTREESVGEGGVGYFHINGTPGGLTLTAGGTKGDGATHYYVIDRTEKEDDSEFVKRTVPIESGGTYVLDDLPKGGYTVTEYTVATSEEFKVTMPQTSEKTREKTSSALTSGTKNSWKSLSLSYPNEKFYADYFKMVSFGPLYDKDSNRLLASDTYDAFRYAAVADDGKIYTKDVKSHTNSPYKGGTRYNINNAPKIKLYDSRKLSFAVTGVKSSKAAKLGVSWTEYDEKEVKKTCKNAGTEESVTVDDRKWLKIEAPALKEPDAPGAERIAYYYTLKDEKGNLVQGTTDRAGTTVKLRPGESTELKLPAAGSYKVVENIAGSTPVGFKMKIQGYPFGTTEAGKAMEVKVGGKRTVTISKPALADCPAGAADEREYGFTVSGGDFSEEVKIKAGTSQTVTLPKDGTYTIIPKNDLLMPYTLAYTDSGAIYGMASGSSGTITFTNSFDVGAYGYRYIHEYYVREQDDSYTFEGNSQITTRLGRKEPEEIYQSGDISQAPEYSENHYEYFDAGYGWVDPVQEASLQSEPDEELPADPVDEEEQGADSAEKEAVSKTDKSAEDGAPDEAVTDSEKGSETESADGTAADSEKDSEAESSDETAADSEKDSEAESPDGTAADSFGDSEAGTSDESSVKSMDNSEAEPAGESALDSADTGEEKVSDTDIPESAGDRTERSEKEMPKPAEKGQEKVSDDKITGHKDMKPQKVRASESYGGNGIVTGGAGLGSDEKTLNYGVDTKKDYINVTEDASQIVILRYFRERQPEGKYNVIHVYYYRDKDGDRWEGISGVKPRSGELGVKYTGKQVDKEYSFKPSGAAKPYTYVWDGRPQYGVVENTSDVGSGNEFAGDGLVYRPNNDWKSAEGTAEGNQIIILRYYRTSVNKGNYNIVHEYYSREDDENLSGGEESVESLRAFRTMSAGAETEEEEEDTAGVFSGTLDRERGDGFIYAFEGNTKIESVTAPLGDTHIAGKDDWKRTYKGNTYTYMDAGYGTKSTSESYVCNPDQQWAASTEQGNEVVILRYYREADETPPLKVSYKVVHEYYVRDGKKKTLVGTSDIREVTDASPDVHYTQKHVSREPDFKGDTYTYFDWGCGTASGQDYSEVSGKQYVQATESGEQIIILRYVREKNSGGSGSHGDSGRPKSSAGKTGDDNRIIFWMVLAVSSLCVIVVLSLQRFSLRRRRLNRRL